MSRHTSGDDVGDARKSGGDFRLNDISIQCSCRVSTGNRLK